MDYIRGETLSLVGLGVPVVTLSFIEFSKFLVHYSQNSPYVPTLTSFLLVTLIALIFAKLFRDAAEQREFSERAKSLGCGPVRFFPHREPILGFDNVREAMAAVKSHRLLDFYSGRFKSCGNTFYNMTLGNWVLMTNEPENIKAILSTSFDDFPIAGPRLYATLPVLGPHSIFTSNGEAWQEARAMLRPSFQRDQVADFKCFDRHIGNLLRGIPADGEAFDIQIKFLDMTMDSSTDFLLGYSTNNLVKPSPESRQITEDFEFSSRESAFRARLGSLLYYLPHRARDKSVKRLREYVRSYMNRTVEEKEKGKGPPKERGYVFLDELLRLKPSEEYTIDTILSILLAGRDTTAAALTASFYFLARNPAVVAKLRKEIEEVGEESPSWETLKNMKYLNNIIKEALRLFPPISTNSRATNKETILPRGGGPDGKLPVLVPKGTPVRFASHSLHRNQDVYGPNAEEFRPERWEENLRVGWSYIPFSGGPRICIGQQFALTQLSYTLYKFFREFKAIEARDSWPLLAQTSLSSSFPYGCLISVERA